MFYSTQILAKKGPLGTVWIASHLDRRLKRSQVFETNLTNTVGTYPHPIVRRIEFPRRGPPRFKYIGKKIVASLVLMVWKSAWS